MLNIYPWQVKEKGPRSPEEKAKREANALARHLAAEQADLPLVEEEEEEDEVARQEND